MMNHHHNYKSYRIVIRHLHVDNYYTFKTQWIPKNGLNCIKPLSRHLKEQLGIFEFSKNCKKLRDKVKIAQEDIEKQRKQERSQSYSGNGPTVVANWRSIGKITTTQKCNAMKGCLNQNEGIIGNATQNNVDKKIIIFLRNDHYKVHSARNSCLY